MKIRPPKIGDNRLDLIESVQKGPDDVTKLTTVILGMYEVDMFLPSFRQVNDCILMLVVEVMGK